MIENTVSEGNRPWASIILAAGKGIRMKSEIPKVMHHLLGKPLIGHVLGLLRNLDIGSKVVVAGHGSDLVRDYLKKYDIKLVVQEQQLGTGHATLCAKAALGEFCGNVLIICGDTPLLKESTLASFMEDHAGSGRILSLLTAHLKDPTGYGRVLRSVSEEVLIQGIVEEKDATEAQRRVTEINTGIYAVDSDFLFHALDAVGCDNVQGEYYLTDIVSIAVSEGVSAGAVSAAAEDEAWGVNSRMDLARAETILLDRIRKSWMEFGVSFELYESVYIEPDVTLSRDVTIGPHVVLKGRTTVGEGVKLGAFSYLEGVQVSPGSIIPPFSKLISA
jgi:bifunctional UDP-N-acetylglucosamine pyrophosphorylase/glucosamine-1-phosphate N-acetyltransferase